MRIFRNKSHEWITSQVGHGEQQCAHCRITNREAAVLNQLNGCSSENAEERYMLKVSYEELEALKDAAEALRATCDKALNVVSNQPPVIERRNILNDMALKMEEHT